MKLIGIILPLALAIVLIWLLVVIAGLDVGSVAARLSDLGGWWAAVVLATALQLGFSAEKWQRALNALNDEPSRRFSFGTCFFYTSLAAVMSQILTVYVASITVRALATRIHHNLGLGRGAASSGFEQLFDIAVLAVIAVPTFALIAFELGTGVWLALVIILALAVFALLGRTPRIVERLRRILPGRRIRLLIADPSVDRLSDPRLSRQFFALSLARYASMFGRVAVICFAAGLWVGVPNLLAAFNAGQLSQLAALTPGNIGLFEWSWSGVMALRGVPLALALEMAIVIRVATFISFLALTLLSGVWMVAERGLNREGCVS